MTGIKQNGRSGGALASLQRIIESYGLNANFPVEVDEDIGRLTATPGIDDPSLVDLTSLPFCTIDDADTRDLDQALYAHRESDGHRILYAIADASWFVRPGSALFEEALRRGASYYLPGLKIPMLPRILSEDLISLGPDVDRRALVFDMRIDTQGHCTSTEIVRARIRSLAKLSFETVQRFLDDPSTNRIDPTPLAESLEAFREVGELRLQDRKARDVVRYRRTGVDIRIGGDNLQFVILDDLRNDVERYNEEFSLLCNVEGARYLREGDTPDDAIQPIYRVHPDPDPDRVTEFDNVVAALVAAHGLDPTVWSYRHGGDMSLADYLRELPDAAETRRIAATIHRQAMLMNTRSSFSHEAGGHYGVGADVYARFSAPMREIVGVFLHAEAVEKLGGRGSRKGPYGDERLRCLVLERANEAKRTQSAITKAANRLVLDQVFKGDEHRSPGDRAWYTGTVMGARRDRLYVLLDEPRMEVKVYFRDLGPAIDDWLELDESGVEVRARKAGRTIFRLGDAVHVQVMGRDRGRDRWKLRAHLAGRK